ncbi:uncharacterized protein LOC125659796 [Ostrea edulis]|uniref:uncharacterized protein LOC125659796 n=1 Tax=Ostrea edulis TaxID=37623 RepID=UPI0024AFDAA4|nr:uncharacterized protein LOC125659796 [Ostrea edulis]
MASNVELTEDDIPGAKFVHLNVEEHTNLQLKRWLKCRGLVSGGKRNDLIERCKDAIRKNVKIDLGIDDGKWHDIKKAPVHPDNQVPLLPISGWKKFPANHVPKHFNYGHIYHYLVESLSAYGMTDENSTDTDEEKHEEGDVHTSKSFTKGKFIQKWAC